MKWLDDSAAYMAEIPLFGNSGGLGEEKRGEGRKEGGKREDSSQAKFKIPTGPRNTFKDASRRMSQQMR